MGEWGWVRCRHRWCGGSGRQIDVCDLGEAVGAGVGREEGFQ